MSSPTNPKVEKSPYQADMKANLFSNPDNDHTQSSVTTNNESHPGNNASFSITASTPKTDRGTMDGKYASANRFSHLMREDAGGLYNSDQMGTEQSQVNEKKCKAEKPLHKRQTNAQKVNNLNRAINARRFRKTRIKVVHLFCEQCTTFYAMEKVCDKNDPSSEDITVFNCNEHNNATETVFLSEDASPTNCVNVKLPNKTTKLFLVDSGASASVLPDHTVNELKNYIQEIPDCLPRYVQTASRREKVEAEYYMSFSIDGQKFKKYRFLHIRSCDRSILGLNFLGDQKECSFHFHSNSITINGVESQLESQPKDSVQVRAMQDVVILPRTLEQISIKLDTKKNRKAVNFSDMYQNIDCHAVHANNNFDKIYPELSLLPALVNQRRTNVNLVNHSSMPILIEKDQPIAIAGKQSEKELMHVDEIDEYKEFYRDKFMKMSIFERASKTKNLYNSSSTEEEMKEAEMIYKCYLHEEILKPDEPEEPESETSTENDYSSQVDQIFGIHTENFVQVEDIGPDEYAENCGYGENKQFSFKPNAYSSELIPENAHNKYSPRTQSAEELFSSETIDQTPPSHPKEELFSSENIDQTPLPHPEEELFSSEPIENPDEIPKLSKSEMKKLRESMHNLPPEVDLNGLTNKDLDKLTKMCKIEFKSGSNNPRIDAKLRTQLLIHHRAFCTGFENIGMINDFEWDIETINKDHTVIKRAYPIHPKMDRLLNKEISDQMRNGLLISTTIGNRSPCLCVPKKNDDRGTPRVRLLTDFRCLNKTIVNQSWPLPSFSSIIDWFAHEKPKYLSTLDIFSGYSQIKLSENSQKLVGTVTRSQQFTYRRAPQGLASSSAVFLKKMHERMSPTLQQARSVTWCDDFLVASDTPEEMIDNIVSLLQCAIKNGITFSAFKGNFIKQEVEFAGCYWTPEGVKADESKVKVMKEFPTPKNRKQLRSFLGLASWFRAFIHRFADIASPLYDSTRGASTDRFIWTEQQEKAFQELKGTMSNSPVIAYPNEDLPIYIYCDASESALGWIICQYEDKNIIRDLTNNKQIPKTPAEIDKLQMKGHLLGYGAKRLNEDDKKKSIHWKEIKAIQLALRSYHTWTSYAEVHILTDRSSILDIFKSGKQKQQSWRSAAVERMLIELEFYSISIQYIPTDKNPSDCISRTLDLPQTETYEDELSNIEEQTENIKTEDDHSDVANQNESTYIITSDDSSSEDESESETETTYTDEIPRESTVFEYILDDTLIQEFAPCTHDECHTITEEGKESEYEVPRTIGYLQETCPKLKHIFEIIKNPTKPLSEEAKKNIDHRTILQIHQYYINSEGQLMYLYDQRTNRNMPMNAKFAHRELLVVPLCLRKKVIDQAHSSHCSPQRTQELLLRRFFWPGMYGEVKKYIGSCMACTRGNNRKHKPMKLKPEEIPERSSLIFSNMSIDLQGPWPVSKKKRYKYTLTATDLTTRYTWIIGLKEATSEHIAKALYNDVFVVFGVPSRVHSDIGSNLVSNFLSKFLQLVGVKKRTITTSRHPSSNSVVERQHFTVNSFLRKKMKGISSGEWENHLTHLNYVIRHTTMRSIGCSPSYLLTGAPINQNLFNCRAPPDQDGIERSTMTQFVTDMDLMRQSHEDWLNHQREVNIKKFNETRAVRHIRRIRENDIVVARTESHVPGAAKKFEYVWSKPMRVVNSDKAGHTFQLQDLETKKLSPNRWNYVNLRRCILPSECPIRTEYDKEIDRRRQEYYPKSKQCKKSTKKSNNKKTHKINETKPKPKRVQPHRKCKEKHSNQSDDTAFKMQEIITTNPSHSHPQYTGNDNVRSTVTTSDSATQCSRHTEPSYLDIHDIEAGKTVNEAKDTEKFNWIEYWNEIRQLIQNPTETLKYIAPPILKDILCSLIDINALKDILLPATL